MEDPMETEPVAPHVETLNEETEEYVEQEQDQINEIESDQENAVPRKKRYSSSL